MNIDNIKKEVLNFTYNLNLPESMIETILGSQEDYKLYVEKKYIEKNNLENINSNDIKILNEFYDNISILKEDIKNQKISLKRDNILAYLLNQKNIKYKINKEVKNMDNEVKLPGWDKETSEHNGNENQPTDNSNQAINVENNNEIENQNNDNIQKSDAENTIKIQYEEKDLKKSLKILVAKILGSNLEFKMSLPKEINALKDEEIIENHMSEVLKAINIENFPKYLDLLKESKEKAILKDWYSKSDEERKKFINESKEAVKEEVVIETEKSVETNSIDYNKEKLEEVIEKIKSKSEEFKNKVSAKGKYFDIFDLPKENELSNMISEEDKTIILDWAKKDKNDKVKFIGKYNEPSKDSVGSNKDEKTSTDNENRQVEEQNQATSTPEKSNEDMPKENKNEKVYKELLNIENREFKLAEQNLTPTFENLVKEYGHRIGEEKDSKIKDLEDRIAELEKKLEKSTKKERKKFSLKIKNKEAVWKNVKKWAIRAGAALAGFGIGLFGPIGTGLFNIAAITAQTVINHKIKKIRLEKVAENNENKSENNENVTNISEADEETKEKVNAFKKAWNSEETLTEIKRLIKIAQVSSLGTMVANNLIDMAASKAAEEGIAATAEQLTEGVGQATEQTFEQASQVATDAAEQAIPQDFSVGDAVDLNGSGIDNVYDTQMYAAEGINAETPLEWISADYSSTYDSIRVMLPDGSFETGQSLSELMTKYPDATNFVGRINSPGGYQGWVDLSSQAAELASGGPSL